MMTIAVVAVRSAKIVNSTTFTVMYPNRPTQCESSNLACCLLSARKSPKEGCSHHHRVLVLILLFTLILFRFSISNGQFDILFCHVFLFPASRFNNSLINEFDSPSCLQGVALKNDPTPKMWLLSNAWKFLHQILHACSAGCCPLMCCFCLK